MKDISIIIPDSIIQNDKFSDSLNNIAVTKAGYYNTTFDHKIKREGITECVLIYCIDGEGWLEYDGAINTISKGGLIFCDKNAPHSYGSNPSNPWTIFWIHFTGSNTGIYSKELSCFKKCISFNIGYQPKVIEFMNEILNLLEKDLSSLNLIQCSSYLVLLLSHVINYKNSLNFKSNIYDKYIDKVIKYMNDNIYSIITLDQMSSLVGLSKYHFSRQFKNATNYSPIEYFNRIKIQKACDLLTSTNLTINEISIQLSYNSPYYFSEYFKQVTGFSPSQFRQLINTKY